MALEHTMQHLAHMDWPWKAEEQSIGIILVSDDQFVTLAEHPDEAVVKPHPRAEEPVSLRDYCRMGASGGATKLRIAYDYFFGGSQRSLYPDTEAFQDALKKVHDIAEEFGLGLEPSILSPLELGVGYKAKTGESGRWMHYREGLRDVDTGAYTVMMWQHLRWTNNKGPMPVKLIGARAFAFAETRIPNSRFFAVDPQQIVELDAPTLEQMPGTGVDVGPLAGGAAELESMFSAVRVRVHGMGGPKELDRVLVVLLYETVEMDYFSPSAAEFMDRMVQGYHDRGISLAGIYSDEMHIQQDWSYHSHFDNGQFTVRYVSPGFERAFAAKYGSQYTDFAKFMVYFTCHQHDFLATHEPKLPAQHVFGGSDADIIDTLEFRRNYYDFLERGVVELMVDAREQLETLNGKPMDVFYHATWAESPTCDAVAVGGYHEMWTPEEHQRRYDYTPDFVWSNTVQQAAAACANYFLWNEFLTGGNDDTPEGGFADRNYYGRALACSLAALNRNPRASAGMWGMPPEVRRRMTAVSAVFGAGGHPGFRSVVDYGARASEVLFLYPQDLVAIEERFGSWIVQYGYANYITAEKLVEYGRDSGDGILVVQGAEYKAVCVLYEPFPDPRLMTLLEGFAAGGGTVVWTGIPPLHASAREWLRTVFGAQIETSPDLLGLALPARLVTFEGALQTVPAQSILTDFVVDRVFALNPEVGTQVVARTATGGPSGTIITGTRRMYEGGGQAILLGFRPRDDQAASTGVELRTWFEVLHALGVYAGVDNPTVVSRTTNLLATTFPNGAVALCPHYRTHAESWPGGFYRDSELDKQLMRDNPPPSDHIDVHALCIAGQTIHYQGQHAVAWRYEHQHLLAFAGEQCTSITVDGQSFAWSQDPVNIAWHPLGTEYSTAQFQPLYRLWCGSLGQVHLPLGLEGSVEVWRGASVSGGRHTGGTICPRLGYGEVQVPFSVENGELFLNVDENLQGFWLFVVKRQ